MLDAQQLEQFVGELDAELLALVGDHLERASEPADPSVVDGPSDGGSVLAGDDGELNILGESVSHREDVLLVSNRFQRSCVNPSGTCGTSG